MHIVLGDVPNCDAYLDDIVIYSETWEDHLKTLKMVFERLESASLTLNLTKCEIGKATITYLGKKVGEACGCQSGSHPKFSKTPQQAWASTVPWNGWLLQGVL